MSKANPPPKPAQLPPKLMFFLLFRKLIYITNGLLYKICFYLEKEQVLLLIRQEPVIGFKCDIYFVS